MFHTVLTNWQLGGKLLLVQEPEFPDSITSQVDPAHIKQTNCKTSGGGWKFTATKGDVTLFLEKKNM